MGNLSDTLVMSAAGESGDTTQFADYLRSRTPFHVNLLIAGYDKTEGECQLYVMDYLASMVKAPYACHGYGGFFTTALLDRHYRKDMNKEEAYGLIQDCVEEVQKRLIVNLPNFQVKVIDRDGITTMPDISIKTIV